MSGSWAKYKAAVFKQKAAAYKQKVDVYRDYQSRTYIDNRWDLCLDCENASVNVTFVQEIYSWHPYPDACCACFRVRLAMEALRPRRQVDEYSSLLVERTRKEMRDALQAMLDRCFNV